ncbi:hyaluronidase-1 isoform X1 [Elgaria multicarinata webbii]|uniref:hyaluronidase-1 isoform X1 n=1 Tax=Elgaria multicarinata webbii TaxID=159646 RepID=UPI002FCCEA31
MCFNIVIIMAYLTMWACFLNVFTMAWYHGMAGGGPVVLDHPFITVWNTPSQICQENYNVSLDLEVFYVVSNQNETFMGSDITLFYSDKLGYYPYYTVDGAAVNGGIPQNASLKDHLWKAQQDIKGSILEADFKGLAVVDWESWRPLWVRNWGSMKIYQNRSIELVKQQHPDWPADKVTVAARLAFEQNSRAFMEKTLALGKDLRPEGFWGFYSYPSCYNYDYKYANYTGECPKMAKQRNEELQWLWNQSRALYPSIYLSEELSSYNKTLEFVRHRVHEAFRIVNLTENGNIPVLPYASIVYDFTQNFLSQEVCLCLKSYMDSLLGPYIINVTSSTRLCSQVLCSKNGRCVRQENHPEAFLHLSPASFTIKRQPVESRFIVTGQMSQEEKIKMAQEFMCQCYSGWEGLQCDKKSA